MNILVTAGNTLALIDRVRCITNIFTGRTGASIALHAHGRGHSVTLLTSHPEAVGELQPDRSGLQVGWVLRPYRTFEDLQEAMSGLITQGGFDAVIHCAAVSDYLAAGVYAPREGTTFQREEGQGVGHWSGGETPPTLVDRQAGKIKSDEAELWVRLVRAPKLVDRIRNPWGFQGQLVKFKLEVGVSDEELLDIAERSRVHSRADLLVANTLENAAFYAFLGPLDGKYERLARRNLAGRLVDALEQRHKPHEEGPRRG